ncbi:hypothetical protein WN48_07535 [Eufriesea mexicana]|uniref:Uncharacterized protein n=1 Tax=Eufriesea mexicana TaxID=516756 RepID=A0A310SLL1_9HYME|nr:hypothetical protein WN48_07535 [Eufriesea mexicana]
MWNILWVCEDFLKLFNNRITKVFKTTCFGLLIFPDALLKLWYFYESKSGISTSSVTKDANLALEGYVNVRAGPR